MWLDQPALIEAIQPMGVVLEPGHLDTFERFAQLLSEWNQRFNLTRISDPRGIAVEHIADSMALVPVLDAAADGPARRGEGERHETRSLTSRADRPFSVVDVGSGAGLPGLVLAVVRPDWSITLVESARKKGDFLEIVIRELGLERVDVDVARAEDAGRSPNRREAFGAAVARAVAPMPALAEYLLPLVAVGGVAAALKGANAEQDARAAQTAIAALGGRLDRLEPYTLPGLDQPRNVVVVKKIASTPSTYPRRAGLPSRAPLG